MYNKYIFTNINNDNITVKIIADNESDARQILDFTVIFTEDFELTEII